MHSAVIFNQLRHAAADIKLSHSVFALPFALLATFLAAGQSQRLPSVPAVGLIVVCMALARTMAMAFNRWSDAAWDARNPRTAARAIPSGRLSPAFMLAVALACAGGFLVATAGFWMLDGNFWPVLAAPLVLVWLAFYSFTKRFTWLSHLVLGSALALSSPAAALAIHPAFLGQAEPYLLALMVLCWVAGFDIIYALQDVQFDRQQGLHSMPARLGVEPALWISRGLHLLSLASLVGLALLNPHLRQGFDVGLILVAVLLVLEHVLVWGSRTHHIHLAFFTVNGLISLLLGGLGILDVARSVT